MLTEENIIDINEILILCGASRLNTEKDVSYLNAIGAEVNSKCDIYKVTQTVLLDRLKNQTGERNYSQLSRLKMLANAADCNIEDKKPEIKKATVPFFGGSL
jgi:hypothetical protein